MSLLDTKPSWVPTAVPTNDGWVEPVSGAIVISIKNLKNMMIEQGCLPEEVKVKRKTKASTEKIALGEVVSADAVLMQGKVSNTQ